MAKQIDNQIVREREKVINRQTDRQTGRYRQTVREREKNRDK